MPAPSTSPSFFPQPHSGVYVARGVGTENCVTNRVERDLSAFPFGEQHLFGSLAGDHVPHSPRQCVAVEMILGK
jgi:hypothetical protein